MQTWCAEATDCPREIGEVELVHRVGDDVERGYAKTTFFQNDKMPMQVWETLAIGAS